MISERARRMKEELGWWWVRGEHRIEPTPELFRELEQIVGCVLDADCREFLTVFGGGSFDKGVQVVGAEPHSWGWFSVEVFFGFYNDNSYDIRKEAREWRRLLPTSFVPFAQDGAANVALFAAAGEHKGRVFFRDKEYREFAAKHRIEDVYREIEQRGRDTERMDIAEAILTWEELHAAELPKPPRFGNLYRMTDSLDEFVEKIQRYE